MGSGQKLTKLNNYHRKNKKQTHKKRAIKKATGLGTGLEPNENESSTNIKTRAQSKPPLATITPPLIQFPMATIEPPNKNPTSLLPRRRKTTKNSHMNPQASRPLQTRKNPLESRPTTTWILLLAIVASNSRHHHQPEATILTANSRRSTRG